MARVTGPSRAELDARGDVFAARVTSAIRSTLREVAADARVPDDLARIQTIWHGVTASVLMPRLRVAWNTAVLGVRMQLEKINANEPETLVAALFDIPKVSNPLAESFLAEAQNRLVAIGDVVWYTARGEMLTGLQLGEGVAELRERVVASANVSEKRATTIARTEVNSAMNNGAYQQMKVLDVPTIKEWIATNDSRTRETHEEVDGEEIAGDEKFMVGGFPMDHPHDLNAPPSETINCRCTLAWEIVDDEDDYVTELVAAGDFDESKHKRDGKGRFAKKAGGGGALSTGKKLKITHGLVHKKHAPGTIIAVNSSGTKRAVWDGSKYLLQEKDANGGWPTVDTAIKSKAYVRLNEFDSEWHEPGGNAESDGESKAASDSPSSALEITQDLFDKKYDLNEVVIVSEDNKKRVIWDGKHYRLQRWNGLIWGTEQLFTKDSAAEKIKSYDLNWQLPATSSPIKTAEPTKKTGPAKKASQSSGTPGASLKITHGLIHSKHEPGTVITENGVGDKRVVWDGSEYRLQHKTDAGTWTTDKKVKKSKAYVEVNAYDSDWRVPGESSSDSNSTSDETTGTQPDDDGGASFFDSGASDLAVQGLKSTEPQPLTGYKKVGGQAGSNEGGLYQAPDGEKWYVKAPKTDNHARNEVLANRLYERAGVAVPDVELAQLDGGPLVGKTGLGVKSKIVDGERNLKSMVTQSEAFKSKLHENFAVDAWLGNWDVVGLNYDNIITTKNDEPLRIDAGGSLLFRAKGMSKGSAFGSKVTEIDTLRDYSINPQSANVFNGVTDNDIRKGVAKIEAIQPAEIDAMVDDAGFQGKTAQRLKDTLKARRQDLIKRFGSGAQKNENSSIDAPAPTTSPNSTPTPTSTSAPTSTPTPTPAANSTSSGVSPKSMFDLTKVSTTKNGTIFADPAGIKYLVKPSPSEAHARNQFLAASLYNFTGVAVEQTALVDIDPDKLPGHSGIGVKTKQIDKSPYADVTDPDSLSDKTKQQLARGFAIDAWLGNWNPTGTAGSNLVVDKYGDVYRTNVGGSLFFRNNGLPKQLSDKVDEIDSLRNPNVNPTAAKVFANVTDDDIRAAVLNLEKLKPATIDFIVEQSGFTGDEADALKKKLKARRQDLIDRFGSMSVKTTSDDEATPAPSTQPTATNALGGVKTLTALQKAKVQTIFNKHGVKWHNKSHLIYSAALEVSQTHPDLTIGDALDAMDGTLKKTDKPFRTKIEKWLKTSAGKSYVTSVGGSAPVGSTASKVPGTGVNTPTPTLPSKPAAEFATPLPRNLTVSDADILQERLDKAWPPPWTLAQRAALKKYTGNAYVEINKCLRQNVGCTPATLKTVKDIRSAVKPSTDNITVYRSVNPQGLGIHHQTNDPAFDKQLQSMVGKEFTDQGVTSTSIRTGVFSGALKLQIDVPKGAKIAWVKRLSQHNHEDEIILAPGTKFEILSVEPHPTQSWQRIVKVRIVLDEAA